MISIDREQLFKTKKSGKNENCSKSLRANIKYQKTNQNNIYRIKNEMIKEKVENKKSKSILSITISISHRLLLRHCKIRKIRNSFSL